MRTQVAILWQAGLALSFVSLSSPPVHPAASSAAEAAPAAVAAVEAVLDDFHRAAAEADEERYFGHLAPNAVFHGTDAGERWTRDEFREYAHPYFARGQGWTYKATVRHIVFSTNGEVAWFDEILDNENYGTCRGTGVLQLREGSWKIEQYHLTIPVPNALARQVVEQIRALDP